MEKLPAAASHPPPNHRQFVAAKQTETKLKEESKQITENWNWKCWYLPSATCCKKKERKKKKKKKKPALLGEKGHDDHLSREGLFGKHSISNKGFDDQHSQKALLISRGRKACGNFW